MSGWLPWGLCCTSRWWTATPTAPSCSPCPLWSSPPCCAAVPSITGESQWEVLKTIFSLPSSFLGLMQKYYKFEHCSTPVLIELVIAFTYHQPLQLREREKFTSKSHISLWEHSSHFRLIGRGVPSVSVVSQLMYKFLCLASPKENPQVPM